MTTFDPVLAQSLPTFLGPALALVAGILILIRPALLAKIVAIYLIIVGLIGLLG
jgi:hypothetical protein